MQQKGELLTGDMLTVNQDEYYIKTRTGEKLFLGKLLRRDRFYSPFHEAYSLYNDIFQFEVIGEGADGRLFGKYKVSRVAPSFQRRLAYFGLDRAWRAALDEAENG